MLILQESKWNTRNKKKYCNINEEFLQSVMGRVKSTKLRIWELKDRSREMSQTEIKKENSFLHKRTDDVRTVGQLLTLNIHIIGISHTT